MVYAPYQFRNYVNDLAASGILHFGVPDVQARMGGSANGVRQAAARLVKQGLLAIPARGFYLVVPPEYRSIACLPAEEFIPALMERLGLPYYVGLLSAAQYHGAADHMAQPFQVVLPRARRPISCGGVDVEFFARKHLDEVPLQSVKTPRGTILASSPEATALDLIGYADQVGGLGQVATVISKLAERIDGDQLVRAAATAHVAWAQRLGFVLERLGFAAKMAGLKEYVHPRAKQTMLLPKAPQHRKQYSRSWKLFINADLDAARWSQVTTARR